MTKIIVEIESSDKVNITAESIEKKWNHNLLEENKIKVKNLSSLPDDGGEKTKTLESEIAAHKIHIENLQEQILFLEGRLESRTAINNS